MKESNKDLSSERREEDSDNLSSVRFRLDFYWVPGTQGINKS